MVYKNPESGIIFHTRCTKQTYGRFFFFMTTDFVILYEESLFCPQPSPRLQFSPMLCRNFWQGLIGNMSPPPLSADDVSLGREKKERDDF